MAMMGLTEIQEIIGTTFFDNNFTIAGIVMYIFVLMLVFGLFRSLQTVLIISMPVTLIFSILGLLDSNVTILLIIVAVLGLASTARRAW